MNKYIIKYLDNNKSIQSIIIKANTKLEALNQMPEHWKLLEFIVGAAE
jgi:hypothetical protein